MKDHGAFKYKQMRQFKIFRKVLLQSHIYIYFNFRVKDKENEEKNRSYWKMHPAKAIAIIQFRISNKHMLLTVKKMFF